MRCRLRLSPYLLLLLMGAPLAAQTDGVIRTSGLAIFPVGWESVEQIEGALAAAQFQLDPAVRTTSGLLVGAPIEGRAREVNGQAVLENSDLRIVFPSGDLMVGREEIVHVGENLIRFPGGQEIWILYLLRNRNSNVPRFQFRDNFLSIRATDPEKIYSISRGKVALAVMPPGDLNAPAVTVLDDSVTPAVSFLYSAVENVAIGANMSVKEGTFLGHLLAQASPLSLGIAVHVRGVGYVNPLVVYVESIR